jgi:hypothetical protein
MSNFRRQQPDNDQELQDPLTRFRIAGGHVSEGTPRAQEEREADGDPHHGRH